MSAVDNSLAGLTLDDVLGKAKRAAPPPAQNKAKQSAPPPAQNKAKQSDSRSAHNKAKQSEPPPPQNRTLPDETSTKDKMSWKLFREKFRLSKAAGAAWTSSIPIPASDVNVQGNRSKGRRILSADANHADDGGGRAPAGKPRPQLARRTSVRFDSHDSGNAHHHSTNDDDDDDEDNDDSLSGAPLGKERSLSAREAVASQEAAEAAAAAAAFAEQDEPEGDEPVKMSLMDLLGEEGSSYIDEDDDCCEEDEEEEEEEEEIVQAKGTEFTCCVCKVDITSSAFMPCAHTFCRLCSKELSVQRGNCPLCSGFVFEIIQIF